MASASFQIDPATGSYGTAGEAQDVASTGGTVNARLVSVSGINPGLIKWSISGTHGVAAPTITLSGTPVGQIASFTVPAGAGQAFGIRCDVNGGEAVTDDAATTSKSAVYVLNDQGRRPFFIGETFEADSDYAIVPRLNAVSAAAGTPLESDWKDSVRVATAAALPAHTFSAGVITMSAVGVVTIDGVATVLGDRIIVKDEGGGTSLENGWYDCTIEGDGSTAGEFTRTVDADADGEITNGSRSYVAEGTANAGKDFLVTTLDPITVNTTPITFTETGGGGAGPGTDSLSWTVNQDGIAGTNEDPELYLRGGDGSELMHARFHYDTSSERVWLHTGPTALGAVSDRTTRFLIGPRGGWNATGNDADCWLQMFGHHAGDQTFNWSEFSVQLDSGTRKVIFGAPGFNYQNFEPGQRGFHVEHWAQRGADADGSNDGQQGGDWTLFAGNGGDGTAGRPSGDGGSILMVSGDSPLNSGGGAGVAGDFRIDTGIANATGIGGTIKLGDFQAAALELGSSLMTSGILCKSAIAIDSVSAALNYLDLDDGNTAPISAANHARLRSNAGTLEVSNNGGAYAAVSTGGISGTGTNDRAMRWDGTSAAQDSAVSIADTTGSMTFHSDTAGVTIAMANKIAFGGGQTLTIQGQNNATSPSLPGGGVSIEGGTGGASASGSVIRLDNNAPSGPDTCVLQLTAGGDCEIDVGNTTGLFRLQRGAGVRLLDVSGSFGVRVYGDSPRKIEFSNGATATDNYIRPLLGGTAQTLYVTGWESNGAPTGGNLHLRGGANSSSGNAGQLHLRGGKAAGAGTDGAVRVNDPDDALMWRVQTTIEHYTDRFTFGSATRAPILHQDPGAGAQTTDATVTTAHSYTVTTGESVLVEMVATFRSATDGDSGSTMVIVAAENTGGTTAIIGTNSVVHAAAEDAGWGTVQGAPVIVDASGADLRARVEGQAADTVDWNICFRVIRSQAT